MAKKTRTITPADHPAVADTNIHTLYKCLRSWQQCRGAKMRQVYETDTHITLQCMGCRSVQRHPKQVMDDAETD